MIRDFIHIQDCFLSTQECDDVISFFQSLYDIYGKELVIWPTGAGLPVLRDLKKNSSLPAVFKNVFPTIITIKLRSIDVSS